VFFDPLAGDFVLLAVLALFDVLAIDFLFTGIAVLLKS
jgi:hypothetical protein